MSTLSEQVLHEIECQKIAPIPCWRFQVKEFGLWILIAIVTVLGGFTVAHLIAHILNPEWEFLWEHSRFGVFLEMAPFFWFILFTGASVGIYRLFRSCSRGYIIPPLSLITGSILVSCGLGYLGYYLGVNRDFDRKVLAGQSALVQEIFNPESIWLHPEAGRLMGTIAEVGAHSNLIIHVETGAQWIILTDAKTTVRGIDTLTNGTIIKIHGDISTDPTPEQEFQTVLNADTQSFKALEIWQADSRRSQDPT